jgi:hypothetical protein
MPDFEVWRWDADRWRYLQVAEGMDPLLGREDLRDEK